MIALRLACLTLTLSATGCLLPDPFGFEGEEPPAEPPRPPPVQAICGDGRVSGTETCDDGNLAGYDGCSAICQREATVRARWQIATFAGQVQPCPAGFDTAELVLRDSVWTLPVRVTAPCDAGTAEALVVMRDYDVQVHIKNGATGELYGESQVARFRASEPWRESEHTIVTDAGKISVFAYPWLGTQPRFCAGLLTSYKVVVRGAAGQLVAAHTFSCDHGGVTQLLPVGTYRVEFSAVSVSGATASAVIPAVDVPGGGRTAKPDPVDLVF
jgi:cysteine-rich repeat protein